MKKSEYLILSLVTRLNDIIDGRSLDSLDEYDYSLFRERLYSVAIVAQLCGFGIHYDKNTHMVMYSVIYDGMATQELMKNKDYQEELKHIITLFEDRIGEKG